MERRDLVSAQPSRTRPGRAERSDFATNLRDLLLVLFLGPVGLLTGILTLHAGRQAGDSRSQTTVDVVIVLAGAWLTWVLITVLFGHEVVQSS